MRGLFSGVPPYRPTVLILQVRVGGEVVAYDSQSI